MQYKSYVTVEEFKQLTGISDPPSDIDSLISNASDLVTNSIMIEILPAHDEVLKLAVCAQVVHWMHVGEQDENAQQVQSYSAGSVSVSYVNDGPKKPLCVRARAYLNKQGLLYRGVRIS